MPCKPDEKIYCTYLGPASYPLIIFIFKAVDLVDLKSDCASISTVSKDQYHTHGTYTVSGIA